MAIIFILCVLVLGYVHIENTPIEKAKLKRSNNWEAYVMLGKHGLFYMCFGLITALLLALIAFCFYFILLSLNISLTTFDGLNIYQNSYLIYSFLITSYGFAFLLSFIVSRYFAKKHHHSDLYQLKHQDGFLNVALEAMENNHPIKISLKSKKVYVGIVYHEQFKHIDFDNLVIIPYLSGYRDKDTLKTIFDCNYTDIYQKYGIQELSETQQSTLYQLSNFRLSIRVSEIESIAFFYQQLFDDFLTPKS